MIAARIRTVACICCPYAEAEGQSWSHLIFAGFNEEAWPALDEEFVANGQIDEFNQRNKS